ncbi:PH domain-containing protein [Sunxiuqinia sp. sy24]|uniref:PH domain-containing protein n=1 Tax=Sunxiuqinia sp. sy24 TaxID=3461495 RepID=UPI0040456956
MKKYNSKIGGGILFFLIVIIGCTSILMVYHRAWLGLVINLFVGGFVGYLFMTTYYLVDERVLRIRSGFLVDKAIGIDTIVEISETNNPLASPANSLDRLEIRYTGGSILISPADKAGFVGHLKDLNSAIKLNLKTEGL